MMYECMDNGGRRGYGAGIYIDAHKNINKTVDVFVDSACKLYTQTYV